MPAGAAIAVQSRKRRQRQEMKRQHSIKMKEQTVKVDAWFASFDTDQSGVLSRDQLKALLESQAGKAPSAEALDSALKQLMS